MCQNKGGKLSVKASGSSVMPEDENKANSRALDSLSKIPTQDIERVLKVVEIGGSSIEQEV